MPCGSPMTPPGLFGSLGPSLLAFTLHRPWSIGVNLSLNLHHAPSTAMSHPSPAHHKPRATSYAHVLSITHHTKGANLPWFLSMDESELAKVARKCSQCNNYGHNYKKCPMNEQHNTAEAGPSGNASDGRPPEFVSTTASRARPRRSVSSRSGVV